MNEKFQMLMKDIGVLIEKYEQENDTVVVCEISEGEPHLPITERKLCYYSWDGEKFIEAENKDVAL